MTKAWMAALLADLNPRDQCAGDAAAAAERHASRWDRHSSPPKRPPVLDDYDIAAHARRSLHVNDPSLSLSNGQINGTSSSSAQAFGGHTRWQSFPEPASASSRVPFPSRASYDRPGFLASPSGPRPLYSQEVSYSASDGYSPTRRTPNGPGGFVDPSSPTYTSPLRPRLDDSNQLGHARPMTSSSSGYQTPPRIRPPYSSTNGSPHRPHATSTPVKPATLAPPTPPPGLSHRPHTDPERPSPKKSRKHSVAASPSEVAPKPNQCHGITGAGKRCTRVVKGSTTSTRSSSPTKAPASTATPARLGSNALRQLDRRLSVNKHRRKLRGPQTPAQRRVIELSSEDEDDFDDTRNRLAPVQEAKDNEDELEELPVYCYQHAKQTLEQRGAYIGQTFVDFQEWIPTYLPQETQLQLRYEMGKPLGADEQPGYIYVHEFPFAVTEADTTFIKLGRSIWPVARLSQWKSQCRSRQPIVRDIFPLHPSHPLHPKHTASSLIRYSNSPSHQHGRLLFADRGVSNHHRWERLCLIEIAGMAATQARERGEEQGTRETCTDCGKIHVELFLVNKGAYEKDIRDIVLRWQRFVEEKL